MASKKPFRQEGNKDDDDDGDKSCGLPVQEPKRSNLTNLWKNVFGGLSVEEFVARLEPFLRQVVREEVNRALSLYDGASREEIPEAGFHLQFADKLPPTIFTSNRVRSERNSPVRIELVDGNTNTVVTIGPLSCLKIEIVALDGDFGSDERENWSEEEFKANILKQREGKRPLVTGDDVVLSLQAGVGHLGEITFTDNSSWTRRRKFRLGARVAARCITNGVRVREGISEPFIVKDQRGEPYRKHHPPLLRDEVWRLEKISRDGILHERLQAVGINTVKDFLRQYEINALALRNILTSTIPKRTWDTIVQHAEECVVNDGEFYSYSPDPQKVVLVFDSVCRVVAAIFDGQNYTQVDAFNSSQKDVVENLKKLAYNDLHRILPLDPSNIHPSWNLTNSQTEQSIASRSYSIATQDATHSLGLNLSSPSTSYGNDAATNMHREDTTFQNDQQFQLYNQTLPGNLVTGDFWSGYGSIGNTISPASSSQGPFPQSDRVINDFQVATTSMLPHGSAWTSDGFLVGLASGVDSAQFSPFTGFNIRNPRISRPRVAWGKIRAIMKWATIRRKAVAKRKASLQYLDLYNYPYQD